jgi:hypothetical protein
VRLVGVVDPNLDRADAVAREFGCRAFGSIAQMLTTHSEMRLPLWRRLRCIIWKWRGN